MKIISEYVKLVKKSHHNFKKISSTSYAVHNIIFRYISFLITPFFIIFNISANLATLLRVVFALIGIGFVFNNQVLLGLCLYFLGDTLDYVDGNLARIQNSASYFGKFVDGFADIIVDNLLIIAFFYVYQNLFLSKSDYLAILFIVTIFLNLSLSFMLERFSNFIKWIRLDKPNYQFHYQIFFSKKDTILINFINDIKYTILILMCFLGLSINILNIFLLISCLYASYRLIIISIMVKNNLKIHRISKNHNPNND